MLGTYHQPIAVEDLGPEIGNALNKSRILMREKALGDARDHVDTSEMIGGRGLYKAISPGARKRLKLFLSEVPEVWDYVEESIDGFSPGLALKVMAEMIKDLEDTLMEQDAAKSLPNEVLVSPSAPDLDTRIDAAALARGLAIRSIDTEYSRFISFHDLFTANDLSKYVMEYVPDASFAQVLRTDGFDGLPANLKARLLKTQANFENVELTDDEVISAYIAGDVASLFAILERNSQLSTLASHSKMLGRGNFRRHLYWLNKQMIQELKLGGVFISVGLSHVIGRQEYPADSSIVQMLRKEGFTVEPVLRKPCADLLEASRESSRP